MVELSPEAFDDDQEMLTCAIRDVAVGFARDRYGIELASDRISELHKTIPDYAKEIMVFAIGIYTAEDLPELPEGQVAAPQQQVAKRAPLCVA